MIREYDQKAPDREETETATFALGCFWGPEAQFGAMDGVIRTRVGYAGGTKLNPTYHDLGDQTEVFQVDYDMDELSYADLLDIVFDNHNPNHQSRKRQYQNIVFADSPEQRETLETYLEANRLDADSIETRVERYTQFYPAESYHQKYNLKANQPLLEPFEEADYADEELRESPAAAKLNGYAVGHDISDPHGLETLLDRGHEVTGVSRSGDFEGIENPKFESVAGNATDPDDVARLAEGHDAVASALGPSEGEDVDVVPEMANGLIEGLRQADVDRLVWIGGAGTLNVGPDTKLMETEEFPEELLPLVRAHDEALELYRDVDDID